MLTKPELASKQLVAISVEPGTRSYLCVKNKNLVYKKEGEIIAQCSLSRVLLVMIIGDTTLTTNLMRDLCETGASVFLLKNNLLPYAVFGFDNQANYLLRRQQYLLNETFNLSVAQSIIADKIHNQATLFKRLGGADTQFTLLEKMAQAAHTPKILLGIEGTASKLFFAEYFGEFDWRRRSPRTKEDIVNFMLDIGYTVLFNFIDAMCRHFGLDTYKGVYHTQFFARRSLVCDLMEPFRYLIDNRTRTALTLKIITPKDFKHLEGRVATDWKTSSKLTQLYAEEVLEARTAILRYVQGFYKHVMDVKNPMPQHRIKR